MCSVHPKDSDPLSPETMPWDFSEHAACHQMKSGVLEEGDYHRRDMGTSVWPRNKEAEFWMASSWWRPPCQTKTWEIYRKVHACDFFWPQGDGTLLNLCAIKLSLLRFSAKFWIDWEWQSPTRGQGMWDPWFTWTMHHHIRQGTQECSCCSPDWEQWSTQHVPLTSLQVTFGCIHVWSTESGAGTSHLLTLWRMQLPTK